MPFYTSRDGGGRGVKNVECHCDFAAIFQAVDVAGVSFTFAASKGLSDDWVLLSAVEIWRRAAGGISSKATAQCYGRSPLRWFCPLVCLLRAGPVSSSEEA